METRPLDCVVIGVLSERLHDALRAELNSLGADRGVQIVDLVVVTKDGEEASTIREVRDLDDDTRASLGDFTGELLGLLSTDDVAQLTDEIPPASSAIVILFEHTWAQSLTDAVRDAGGVALAGGMVHHAHLERARHDMAGISVLGKGIDQQRHAVGPLTSPVERRQPSSRITQGPEPAVRADANWVDVATPATDCPKPGPLEISAPFARAAVPTCGLDRPVMVAGVSRLGRSERHQMHSVIRRLIDEFAPTPTAAVIERVVADVLDTLTLHARFTCYVPLLAERLAREQLRGLVQVG